MPVYYFIGVGRNLNCFFPNKYLVHKCRTYFKKMTILHMNLSPTLILLHLILMQICSTSFLKKKFKGGVRMAKMIFQKLLEFLSKLHIHWWQQNILLHENQVWNKIICLVLATHWVASIWSPFWVEHCKTYCTYILYSHIYNYFPMAYTCNYIGVRRCMKLQIAWP